MKTQWLIIFACMVSISAQSQLTYINKYSPRDSKRPVRTKTGAIILHTTEAGDKSSLNSVHRSGTCNYLVETNGTIYRIIDHRKVAYHAGRSMWKGVTNLSNTTIGIEVVGFHNKEPTTRQKLALKGLIFELQKMYHLADEDVLTHSMVAYGVPNRWFSFKHRGRKRCGMKFATAGIRTKIGLANTFKVDPDVQACRLRNADPYLAKFIYGGSKGAVSKKEQPPVKGVSEPETQEAEQFEGFRIVDSKGVYSIAGADYNEISTIYFFANGLIRTGNELSEAELKTLPKGTKVLVGYIYGGKVTLARTAYQITNGDWNLPSTFYRLPDQTIKSGDAINAEALPVGTIVLFRK